LNRRQRDNETNQINSDIQKVVQNEKQDQRNYYGKHKRGLSVRKNKTSDPVLEKSSKSYFSKQKKSVPHSEHTNTEDNDSEHHQKSLQ